MLLERQPALDALAEALAGAQRGPGRVVLVGGEAGIGKTTLLREFARRAGTPVLWGACDPLFTPRPLAPLHDMAARLADNVAAALALDGGRIEVFATTLGALGRVPQALVFEDVHWADEATLDLLAYLGRRIEATRTLLLASYRDDEIGTTHPLRRLLGALPGALRLSLPPLSPDAVRQLAAGRVADAAALHRACGGNPFLVTELLAVDDMAGVPATVRDAVLARAAHLGAPARNALDAAAVIGPRIEPVLVEAIAGVDASALDACISAGVLREAGADVLEFRHELARQVVLAAIAAPRRLALHRSALAALRAGPGADLARLAHHAEAAQDRDAVLQLAPAAARQAAAVGARRQAHAQYARALRFADAGMPADEHAALLEAFALECLGVGDSRAGISARQRAIALRAQRGERERQAENLCRLSNLLVDGGRNAEADDALREAFELLQPLPAGRELAYAWRTRAHLSLMRNDNDEAIASAQQALALAEPLGDVETIASALNSQGAALTQRDYDAGCALLQRSRDVALAAGRRAQAFNADLNLGEASNEVQRFVSAQAHFQRAVAMAEELQMDATRPQASLALSWVHLGRWDDAGELANQVLRQCVEPRMSRAIAQLALGRLRARRGDAGVWDALDEALRMALGTGVLQYLAPARAVRAEAAWLEGDARRCLDEAHAAYDFAARYRHPWYLGELAYWRRLAGDTLAPPGEAAPPYASQLVGHWREAAAAWRALACPYEEARALAEGDPAACREALATFERLGARPAAEAVRRRLLEAGVRGLPRGPRAATRERPFGLTTRELQVLQLLCEGLRNADIAQRLHRSVRTVDHHLAAVFAKLGVDSRAAAVAAAQRAGLAPQIGQARDPN